MNVEKILSLYKSRVDVAKAAGVKGKSAVTNWIRRGSIPREACLNMLRSDDEFRIGLTLLVYLTKEYMEAFEGESNDRK